jgi:HD-GYP domain-containing protein (c-di-GMP phosphodiesterase class II)
MVLLPKTDAEETLKVMGRIKTGMEKEKVFDIKCSIAVGFDTKIDSSENIEKVMGNAEREMYKEKLLSKKDYSTDTIDSILKTLHNRNSREQVHSQRVALICSKMGKAMGLTEHEVKRLKDIGYIHDIGKIVLAEEILKKEELNENERNQLEQHPVVGYRILNLFVNTLDLADCVYAHHEKWDGTGYPKGIKGEEIPLTSRVLAIADRYEKELWKSGNDTVHAKAAALKEINEQSGKALDPNLAELFIDVMRDID